MCLNKLSLFRACFPELEHFCGLPWTPQDFLSHWRAPGTRGALAAHSNHEHTHGHYSLIFFRKTANHTSNQLLPQQCSSDAATDAAVSCQSPSTPTRGCGGKLWWYQDPPATWNHPGRQASSTLSLPCLLCVSRDPKQQRWHSCFVLSQGLNQGVANSWFPPIHLTDEAQFVLRLFLRFVWQPHLLN